MVGSTYKHGYWGWPQCFAISIYQGVSPLPGCTGKSRANRDLNPVPSLSTLTRHLTTLCNSISVRPAAKLWILNDTQIYFALSRLEIYEDSWQSFFHDMIRDNTAGRTDSTIPVGKRLITMVIVSQLTNGLSGLYMGVTNRLLSGDLSKWIWQLYVYMFVYQFLNLSILQGGNVDSN